MLLLTGDIQDQDHAQNVLLIEGGVSEGFLDPSPSLLARVRGLRGLRDEAGGVDQLQSSFRHLKIMVAGITLALNCLFAYSWRTYVDTRIHG